jgi:DNA-binding HxlR family transcriptional regulator
VPAGGTRFGDLMSTPSRVEPDELEMIQRTHAVLDLLAGRWSVDVLYLLASGTRRYSEIFYEVGEISKKTLTQTLRTLESNGLVTRRAYAEVPVRVEYSLAPLGWSITRLLMTMYEWSAEHAPQTRRAQLRLAGTGDDRDAGSPQRLAA